MLFHHLFYAEELRPLYNDITIHGLGIVNQIGIFSKLCVAMFVFVSGYGLAVSTPPNVKLKDFYWHRFKKLYLNYWFIWLIFVPIGVVVFHRTFEEAYGSHVAIKAILDFFGVLNITGCLGYNPTWWFYSCIIVLYLIFPLLNKFLLRTWFLIVSVSVALGVFLFIPGIHVISGYLFVFIVGMLMSKMPLEWVKSTKVWHIILAVILLSIWRLFGSSPKHIVDGLICVGLAIFLFKVPMEHWLGRIMEELGKQSMNMFLFHTFIFFYWFKEIVYMTRNPIIIFLSLLIPSYLLSIFIEWVKRKVGFYKI